MVDDVVRILSGVTGWIGGGSKPNPNDWKGWGYWDAKHWVRNDVQACRMKLQIFTRSWILPVIVQAVRLQNLTLRKCLRTAKVSRLLLSV
jgi:hypothetical protein